MELLESMLAGFGYSVVALIFFGVYPVVRKLSTASGLEFMLAMTVGVALSTFPLGILLAPDLIISARYVLLSYLSGALWTIGTVAFMFSVDCMGLGRASPIRNTTVIIGVVSGVVLFGEFSFAEPLRLLLVLAGSSLIVYSAMSFGRIHSVGQMALHRCPVGLIPFTSQVRRLETSDGTGVLLAVVTAVCYGLYAVPGKIATEGVGGVFEYAFYLGHSTLVFMAVAYGIIRRDLRVLNLPVREWALGVFGGLLWTIAFIGLFKGVELIGLAVSWSVANLNILASTAVSVFLLKEIDTRSEGTNLRNGLVAALIGMAFLMYSRL